MNTYRTEVLGLLTAFGLLMLLAFASSALADNGPGRAFGGAGRAEPAVVSERMAERLGLDETQKSSIENILEAARPEFEALRAAHEELAERVRTEINAVLTEEQRAQLESRKERPGHDADRHPKR